MKVLKGSLRETLYCWPCEGGNIAADSKSSAMSRCHLAQHVCSATGRRPSSPKVKRSTIYNTDEVTYMSDQLGLHRVENPSKNEVAVSLHLYTVSLISLLLCLTLWRHALLTHFQPPNAAKHGCHIFDPKTGKSSHVKQCHFYSEFGVQKDGLF